MRGFTTSQRGIYWDESEGGLSVHYILWELMLDRFLLWRTVDWWMKQGRQTASR